MNPESWKINILQDEETTKKILLEEFNYCKHDKESILNYFLDIKKQHFVLIEKLLYDIALFHFQRLNLDINNDKYLIECWNHTRDSNDEIIHIDIDQDKFRYGKEIKKPIFTTITYFTDIDNPTIIFDFTNDCFCKNEHINKNFFLSFPKMLKTLFFDGGNKYHSAIDFLKLSKNHSRYVYVMNIWEKNYMGLQTYSVALDNSYLPNKQYHYVNKYYKLFTFTENTCKVIKIKNLNYTCISSNAEGHQYDDKITFINDEFNKDKLKIWFNYITNNSDYITKKQLLNAPPFYNHKLHHKFCNHFFYEKNNNKISFNDFVILIKSFNKNNNYNKIYFNMDVYGNIIQTPFWRLYNNEVLYRGLTIDNTIFLQEIDSVLPEIQLNSFDDYNICVINN